MEQKTNLLTAFLVAVLIGIQLAAVGCSVTVTLPYPWQSSAVKQTSDANHK